MLLEKQVDVVFQQHATRYTDFRKGEKLSARDHIVKWKKPKQKPHWMDQAQYDHFPNELPIQELKSGKIILVTTLLSNSALFLHLSTTIVTVGLTKLRSTSCNKKLAK